MGTDVGFKYNYPDKKDLVAVKLKDDIMPKRMQVIAWNSELELVDERKIFHDFMIRVTGEHEARIDM